MNYRIVASEIFTENEIIKNGQVLVSGEVIQEIHQSRTDTNDYEEIDLSSFKLLPGLVDIHVHGGNGHDTMDLTHEAVLALAKFKMLEGVTSFCPTTVTTSLEKTKQAIVTVKESMQIQSEKKPESAKILGSFLEGPYIDVKCKGAHPENFIREISLDELKELVDCGCGTVISCAIAPNKALAGEAIEYLVSRGVNVRVGHSSATSACVRESVSKGANIAIHTFNAMSGFSHREVGMVGEVFNNENIYAEIICDLVHVHPDAMKVLFKMKSPEKIILITDCMMAGGLKDGDYVLGELPVKVSENIARTLDGALAGSTLSLITAVKNAHEAVSSSLFDAVKMASIVPARAIGRDHEIGSIHILKKADLIAIDDAFHVKFLMINGEILIRP